MQTFLVRYTLSCPTGDFFITCHNEIRDEIIHITKQALYPACVHGEYLIHLSRSRYEEKVRHRGRVPETRGEVSIRGLLESQTEGIIDVRFVDADAETWKLVRMYKFLAGREKIKKYKHGQACYD